MTIGDTILANPIMQCRILIHGRVQGVNYRYFTQQAALRLGIRGYVRNLRSGGVEIAAEGEEAVLDKFVTLLRGGPPAAVVESVEVEERRLGGEYTSFRIEY